MLWALLAPCTAHAGAWPRGDGNAYVYTAVTGDPAQVSDALNAGLPLPYEWTLYAEYGLTPLWTLGFDGLTDSTGIGRNEASLFVTRAVGPGKRHQFAVSAGLGWREDTKGESYTLRLGGHWGLGLENGWVSADVWTIALSGGGTDWKADATYGHRLGKRFVVIGQIQSGQEAGNDPYLKLAPKIGVSFGEDKRQQLELGYVHGALNDTSRKLTLGLSHSF